MNKIIQIGAGLRPIEGFVNYDISPIEPVIYGRADDLDCQDRSVDLIFSNAVFEHLDPKSYSSIFREWKRILSEEGMIIALGIPDFETLAITYLSGGLSLKQVYNYVVGEITETSSVEAYTGQLHKDLFTKKSLEEIFYLENFNVVVFRYCYPEEEHKVNLGVLATYGSGIKIENLQTLKFIEQFIDIDTIEI